MSETGFIILKVGLVVAFTIGVLIMNIWCIVDQPNDEDPPDGIDDKAHDWTSSINEYFAEDLNRRNYLLICNALCIDFLVLVQGLRLLVRGTTFRFFFANIIFYGVRALI